MDDYRQFLRSVLTQNSDSDKNPPNATHPGLFLAAECRVPVSTYLSPLRNLQGKSHMSRNMSCARLLLGALSLVGLTQTADAQWVSAANPCVCVQPIAQTVYRTVPVTEYRQIQQTVTRPVYETKYVDQKVTAYRPITETRTASIPTVSYQNVTEMRTVTRDQSYWQTRYTRRYLPSPCEYDPRPDLFGWLNRTGYAIRSTFTPRTIAHRQFVSNVVAYNVPTTRRVAIHGTRKVTYNVTRMEPYTTTRRVAVNSVRYVTQNITRSQPVTVWRSVPIGSTIALAPIGVTTAAVPTPDPISSAKSGSPSRTANSGDNKFKKSTDESNSGPFRRDSSSLDSSKTGNLDVRRSTFTPVNRASQKLASTRTAATRRTPSIVTAGRWIARRRNVSAGPVLAGPILAQASVR